MPFALQAIDPSTQPLPISDSLPYEITADFSAATFQQPAGADQAAYDAAVQQLQTKFTTLGSGAFMTDATLLIVLEDITSGPGSIQNVQVDSIASGCGFVEVVNEGVLPVGANPCNPFP